MNGLGRINFLRFLRVVMAPFIALNLVLGVLTAVAGSTAAFASLGAALFLAAVVGLPTYAIRRLEKQDGTRGSLPVALLRHVTRRPRRIMTPDDYQHLRELEAELGWEPSGPSEAEAAPAQSGRSFAEQAKVVEDFNKLTAAGSVSMASLLSGAGTLSAPMTGPGGRWRPVSELPEVRQADDVTEGIPAAPLIEGMRQELEAPVPRYALGRSNRETGEARAAKHFRGLARVGRESCIGPCPMCEERDRQRAADESTRQWIEEGRWGQQ